jgi:putative transposase
MNTYKRHRFPPDIISYAVWLYYRFNLSHRDIEDLLAERGITVSREAIRLWCIKFGALYARRLKRKHRGYGDTFYIDEVFVKINGKQHYLWRAVDQDGESIGGINTIFSTNPLQKSCGGIPASFSNATVNAL